MWLYFQCLWLQLKKSLHFIDLLRISQLIDCYTFPLNPYKSLLKVLIRTATQRSQKLVRVFQITVESTNISNKRLIKKNVSYKWPGSWLTSCLWIYHGVVDHQLPLGGHGLLQQGGGQPHRVHPQAHHVSHPHHFISLLSSWFNTTVHMLIKDWWSV